MAQCALLLINSRKIPVWGLYRIVEVEMEEMYILVFFPMKFKQEESAKKWREEIIWQGAYWLSLVGPES